MPYLCHQLSNTAGQVSLFFSFPTYICLKYIPLFSLQEQDIYFISTMFSPVYTCTIFVLLLPLLMVHSHLQLDLHPWIMVTPEKFALKCLQLKYMVIDM